MGLAFHQKTPEGRTSRNSFEAASLGRRELKDISRQAGLHGKQSTQFARFAHREGHVSRGEMREHFQGMVEAGRLDAHAAERAGQKLGMRSSDLHFKHPEASLKNHTEESRFTRTALGKLSSGSGGSSPKVSSKLY